MHSCHCWWGGLSSAWHKAPLCFISEVFTRMAHQIPLQRTHCFPAWLWTKSKGQSEQMLTHLLCVLHTHFHSQFPFFQHYYQADTSLNYELPCFYSLESSGANLEWTSIHYETQDKSVIKDAELKIENLYIMPETSSVKLLISDIVFRVHTGGWFRMCSTQCMTVLLR